MKRKLIYPALALAAALWTGCSKEEAAPPSSRDIEITAQIGTLTRATDRAFDAGDRISVYAYESGDDTRMVVGGVANTLQADGSWTAAAPMKWKDDATAHDFVAVYPENGSLTGFASQTLTLGDDLRANDLLIATATGRRAANGAVPLTFDHVMSRVAVHLTFSDNSAPAPVVDEVVLCCRLSATIDYAAKTVTAAGPAATMTMTPAATAHSYTAVTCPQTLPAGEAMIVVSISGKDYTFVHTAALVLEAGRHRDINLTVNGTAPEDLTLSLGSITVNDWGNSATIEGGEAN